MLAEYGISSSHPRFEQMFRKLYPSFIRRKRYEWRELSTSVINAYANARTATDDDQAPVEQSNRTSSGKAYREISPDELIDVVNKSRVPLS